METIELRNRTAVLKLCLATPWSVVLIFKGLVIMAQETTQVWDSYYTWSYIYNNFSIQTFRPKKKFFFQTHCMLHEKKVIWHVLLKSVRQRFCKTILRSLKRKSREWNAFSCAYHMLLIQRLNQQSKWITVFYH